MSIRLKILLGIVCVLMVVFGMGAIVAAYSKNIVHALERLDRSSFSEADVADKILDTIAEMRVQVSRFDPAVVTAPGAVKNSSAEDQVEAAFNELKLLLASGREATGRGIAVAAEQDDATVRSEELADLALLHHLEIAAAEFESLWKRYRAFAGLDELSSGALLSQLNTLLAESVRSPALQYRKNATGELHEEVHDVSQAVNTINNRILIALFVGAVIGILASFLLARMVLNPLGQLEAAVHDV